MTTTALPLRIYTVWLRMMTDGLLTQPETHTVEAEDLAVIAREGVSYFDFVVKLEDSDGNILNITVAAYPFDLIHHVQSTEKNSR